jgi:hypothetical protein
MNASVDVGAVERCSDSNVAAFYSCEEAFASAVVLIIGSIVLRIAESAHSKYP